MTLALAAVLAVEVLLGLAFVVRTEMALRRLSRPSQGDKIMSALDDLAKQVEANTALEASAVQMIEGLAAEVLASKDDPAKIEALAAQLQATAGPLAAAIAANTPAAPPAPAPEPPAT